MITREEIRAVLRADADAQDHGDVQLQSKTTQAMRTLLRRSCIYAPSVYASSTKASDEEIHALVIAQLKHQRDEAMKERDAAQRAADGWRQCAKIRLDEIVAYAKQIEVLTAKHRCGAGGSSHYGVDAGAGEGRTPALCAMHGDDCELSRAGDGWVRDFMQAADAAGAADALDPRIHITFGPQT